MPRHCRFAPKYPESVTPAPPIEIDHPLLILKLYDQAGDVSKPFFIMDICDWLHVAWRIKQQLLQPSRQLDIGGLLISPSFLKKAMYQLGLTDADLDPANKQDLAGMEKVITGS